MSGAIPGCLGVIFSILQLFCCLMNMARRGCCEI